MADVILAECDGQVWLVAGDEHIDALLIGQLPEGITVEFKIFDNRAAVFSLWHQMSPEPTDGAQPWILNPLIVRRIRGEIGLPRTAVVFTPWSAMLDEQSQGAVADASTWLEANPEGRVVLRQFALATPAPGYADLQRLRVQLVIGALTRAGADLARVTDEVAVATADTDVERLDVLTETQPAP